MSREYVWYMANSVFLGSMVLGYIVGIEGAKNLADFIAWVTIITSLFFLNGDVLDSLYEDYKGRSVSKAIDVVFDVSVVCIFVWYGAIFTGFMYIIHMVLINHMREEMSNRGYEE